MRQRITYLVPEGTGIDTSHVKVGEHDLTYARANGAAEERRITLALDDLPEEIRLLLDDFHELHMRLITHRSYDAFLPLVSRLPPGLHASFTPRKQDSDTRLCSLLKEVLGEDVKCSNSSTSFSKPPILSERFASSATYQFYHASYDLRKVSEYLADQALTKQRRWPLIESLSTTFRRTSSFAYIDIDFDAISHAVTISAFSLPIGTGTKQENRQAVRKTNPSDRLEVGILEPQPADPDEPEELSLGGYLTVLGDDTQPKATTFSFPSRHHPLPPDDSTTYTTTFQHPTGLHPKLDITLPAQHLQPPKETCALYAYFTSPSALFIDRYQLSDPLFLASQNLIALRALSGEEDLEAPDWAVGTWGSAALFELAHPSLTSDSAVDWTITIPTHLRYLNATDSISIPWPVAFWACEAEEGLKMGTNPFDRTNLGYDGLFGPKTMFYHVPPDPTKGEIVEELSVPTLQPEQATWVPFGTAVAILVGFGWICWQLLRDGRGKATVAKGEADGKGKKIQ